MSIPKEPRQLMINIMYLVLTAMLALNVSAEIINAFFALEKGIKDSSAIADTTNENFKKSLAESVKANPKYAEWGPKGDKALQIANDFVAYVDGIRKQIFDAAGGPHPEHPDRPYKYKDKDVTTRILVNEGKGAELEKKISDTRDAFLALVKPSDKQKMGESIQLALDKIAEDSKAATWPEYKFKQMPVAAVMPMLAKLDSDAKNSATTILNYCLNEASGRLEIKLDKYLVAIAPDKAYLISGKDKFEATLAMGAYSSTSNNITISANGQSLPVREGKARYSGSIESGVGTRTFTATATITNPATGEKQTVTGKTEYEVGQTSVAVSADKMNVFYIGVENPISIAAAGVSSNSMNVSCSGCNLSGSGKTRTVTVSSPGEATITVNSPDMASPASFKFRVKRIPDPIARLGKSNGGKMGTGEFKAQSGLIAWLDNFDFDAKCSIQGFQMTYVPKRADPVPAINGGGAFTGQASNLVNMAKPGDMYYFDEVKARCPGDAAGRPINSLAFQIN